VRCPRAILFGQLMAVLAILFATGTASAEIERSPSIVER
jgi:hypothetical protein